ncbi:aldose epimerase family protein [Mucilaginibacter sp. FT3.2]|uniref:aldose epimerase family protein n=1 Tax=Mucilaginibacter sp. FT3.2 TaxID=2723090 RepID=UPI00160AFD86|nr:aldose epimerase family protein [Mucilaginibacter sp. FT3.2]MBB6231576.1 aldose 1-epimerase [Mucilaginibacter sp. FT3.2]
MSVNTITVKNWGIAESKDIVLYQLQNKNGISIAITNYGASIQAINVPDKDGNVADITLGYDDVEGYVNDPYYTGAIVGRFANRIAGGLVTLDGEQHQLTVKPGGFHHHGGAVGFNKKVWQAKHFAQKDKTGVTLEYISPDGEEGFPGELATTVTYTLNNKNQLVVDFKAKTTKTTLVNLTQHAYFNLSGVAGSSILDHELMMPLQSYLPVNQMQVPNGTVTPVDGTPFDFRKATAIGERIGHDNEQLVLSAGYDHSWVIKETDSAQVLMAGSVKDPKSGRVLNVYTTEPAVHLYTGNFIEDNSPGKNGASYMHRSGFCLETQHYPDAPNRAHFPSTVLKPGEIFTSQTIFEFIIAAS